MLASVCFSREVPLAEGEVSLTKELISMETPRERRSHKQKYYLDMAEQCALQSTCLRRNYGAVIVKHDQVIATGYGGATRGTPHCSTEVGVCYRGELGARPGEHYEFCRAVHAEQNAIIQAPRLDMLGAVLYLVGLDAETKKPNWNTEPCRICKRHIVNAGIKQVIARQGCGRIKKFSVANWVKNRLWELRKERGRFIPQEPPRTLSEPIDEDKAKELISRFSLVDARVVQIASYEKGKHAIARVAARYFISKVKTGSSVALSCGDTILSMLQSLPNRPKLRLNIHQLSIENDPAMIHQAPGTLVGLLRSKCSPKSRVYGLQLPPLDLVDTSPKLREELVRTKIFKKMMRDARGSGYVFLGVGSAGPDSTSFWAIAQAATGGKFSRLVKQLGIVGEINNQVFDRSGKDCTNLIPGLDKNVVNIASLADIRKMARNPEEHKVVMVATGAKKTGAMRVALEAGFANVLITGREDADRLLGN